VPINEPKISDLPFGTSFEHPSHDSQYVFRQTLKSMAEPGSIITINSKIVSPPPLSIATAAICLSLLDFETYLWIEPSLATDDVKQYLKFHTGLKFADQPQQANFCILGTQIPDLEPVQFWHRRLSRKWCDVNNPEPTTSRDQAQLQLEGPGIETSTDICL
jgi:phosphonate C-P lyase system protein PhnH